MITTVSRFPKSGNTMGANTVINRTSWHNKTALRTRVATVQSGGACDAANHHCQDAAAASTAASLFRQSALGDPLPFPSRWGGVEVNRGVETMGGGAWRGGERRLDTIWASGPHCVRPRIAFDRPAGRCTHTQIHITIAKGFLRGRIHLSSLLLYFASTDSICRKFGN